MSKVFAFLKAQLGKPAVRHALQVAFTIAAASVASGKLDLSPLLQLFGG